MKVLVIEDDLMVAEVMAAIARLSADTVKIVTTLAGGRQALAAQPYDVVLLDLTLPDSPADRTLAAIESLVVIGARAVYVVTAAAVDDFLLRRAVESGAVDAITKTDLAFEGRLRLMVSGQRPRWTRRVCLPAGELSHA